MALAFKAACILALFLQGLTPHAEAKVIQILHTNDLHASLFTAGAPAAYESEFGGWAQVKSVMDRLTRTAKDENGKPIPTLRLDAGDFSEGTSEYMADNATNIFKAFQEIGYDAVALGNHDWLMGARDLNRALGVIPFSQPGAPALLAANVKLGAHLKNLTEQILPTTQIEIGCSANSAQQDDDCIKVGIIGLTTKEPLYSWIPGQVNSNKKDFSFKAYLPTAKKLIKNLRKENDLVIALTHIGFADDRRLGSNVNGLDLIVGGHSHNLLETYAHVNAPNGRDVPIFQAGFNGKHIGRILVDIQPGQLPKVISYEMVPVFYNEPVDLSASAKLIQAIANAKFRLFELYNKELPQSRGLPENPTALTHGVGKTEVRLVSGSDGLTPFSKFAADSMRFASKPGGKSGGVGPAEVSIDVGSLQGNTPQPAHGVVQNPHFCSTETPCEVNRQMLMELYPRKFETDHYQGWEVYHSYVPGWVIKLGIKYAVQYGLYASIGGIQYRAARMDEREYKKKVERLTRKNKLSTITRYKATDIEVNQAPIRLFHKYKVAAPEGLIRGAYAITALTRLIIRRGHTSGISIWDAMESYLGQIGVIKKLTPNDYGIQLKSNKKLQEFYHYADSGSPVPVEWVTEENNAVSVYRQFVNEVKVREETGDYDSDQEELEDTFPVGEEDATPLQPGPLLNPQIESPNWQ